MCEENVIFIAGLGQSDINAANVVWVNASQITCDFNLTGATVGQWNVVVTNPDAQSGTLPNGFTVYPPFVTPTPVPTSVVPTATPWATSNSLVYLPCILKNACFYPGYFDDFSNPSSGWASGDKGGWSYGYLNGEYQILIKGTEDGFWITPDLVLPSNYVIEVDARHASGNLGLYGLMFGMRRSGDDLIELYRFIVDPSDQTYLLEKYRSDSWQTLIDWTYDEKINLGMATNHLSIKRVGTAITIGVNSYWLNTVYDGDFTSAGRDGGLAAFSLDSAPVDMRFDNFRVSCVQ